MEGLSNASPRQTPDKKGEDAYFSWGDPYYFCLPTTAQIQGVALEAHQGPAPAHPPFLLTSNTPSTVFPPSGGILGSCHPIHQPDSKKK